MSYLLKHKRSGFYVSYKDNKFDLVSEMHKATIFSCVHDIVVLVDYNSLRKTEYYILEIHTKRIKAPWD